MPRHGLQLAALSFALACAGCGPLDSSESFVREAITGGVASPDVQMVDVTTPSRSCTATLVTERLALTTSSCAAAGEWLRLSTTSLTTGAKALRQFPDEPRLVAIEANQPILPGYVRPLEAGPRPVGELVDCHAYATVGAARVLRKGTFRVLSSGGVYEVGPLAQRFEPGDLGGACFSGGALVGVIQQLDLNGVATLAPASTWAASRLDLQRVSAQTVPAVSFTQLKPGGTMALTSVTIPPPFPLNGILALTGAAALSLTQQFYEEGLGQAWVRLVSAATGYCVETQSGGSLLLDHCDGRAGQDFQREVTSVGKVRLHPRGDLSRCITPNGLVVTQSCSASSDWDEVVRLALPLPPPPPPPTPPAPVLSAGLVTTTSIDVLWSFAGTATHFLLTNERTLTTLTLAASARAQTFSNLRPGTTTRFRLLACNGVSCSAPTFLSVTTVAVPLPAAPTELRLCGSQGPELCPAQGLTLVWRDNSSNETSFELDWLIIGAPSATVAIAPNRRSFTLSSMTAGVTHQFRVRACNLGGCSAFTNTVQLFWP